jgi:hypothetical protein
MDIKKLSLEAYPVLMQSIGDEVAWDMNEQYRESWVEGFYKSLSMPGVKIKEYLCCDCKTNEANAGYDLLFCKKCWEKSDD